MDEPMISPQVSVVITCYNYGRYLEGCLRSVLGQTWQDFEVIIVNDGSTDDTDVVIEPYLADERIVYLKQANAGQANAKNLGISQARGNFVAFLDADDLWEPTKLEKQMKLFENPLVGVVYSTARYIDENGRGINIRLYSKYLKPRSGMVAQYLVFDNFVPFSSSVVRMTCFKQTGVFDESIEMGIDWDLWLRISVKWTFQFVSDPLLIYRVGHLGQMSKNLEKRQRCSEVIMQKFSEKNTDIMTQGVMRRVWHYTYMNRGVYYRRRDLIESSRSFINAFAEWPFSIRPVMELLKNLLFYILNYGRVKQESR